MEYQREVHSEIGVAPLRRFLESPKDKAVKWLEKGLEADERQ